MILCDAVGEMVSTEKHPSLKGRKILVVRPVDPCGKPDGPTFLAIDAVGAGAGDRVLVNHEGHAPIDLFGLENPPIRSLIVSVVDTVEVGGETVYRKHDAP